MARRKAKIELTLFPFLSVLSGLIAVNVLFMIVTISTRVMSTEGESALTEGAGSEGADDSQAVADGIDAASYQRLERQIQGLEKELAQKQALRSELHVRLLEIATLIRAKERDLQAATAASAPRHGVRIGQPTPVKIIPRRDGNGSQKTPVFIEVSASEFVLHPQKTSFPYDVGTDPKKPAPLPPELQNALAAIAQDKGSRYPLLLIHPNGAESFMAIRRHILRNLRGLNMGWEPFSREWLVDSSSDPMPK